MTLLGGTWKHQSEDDSSSGPPLSSAQLQRFTSPVLCQQNQQSLYPRQLAGVLWNPQTAWPKVAWHMLSTVSQGAVLQATKRKGHIRGLNPSFNTSLASVSSSVMGVTIHAYRFAGETWHTVTMAKTYFGTTGFLEEVGEGDWFTTSLLLIRL